MVEVVYEISSKGKLLYVGRTKDFERRKKEHLRNITQAKGPRRFRRIFRNVSLDEIVFSIVFEGTRKEVKRKECEIILKFRPPANTEFLDR
jgi:predicted GIY-YIG superfamily endonuclease